MSRRALAFAATFARARWGLRFTDRETLLRWQAAKLRRFLARELPRTGFYRELAGRPLEELPIVDKRAVLARFHDFNTRGVTLEEARAVALRAERSRDFRPTLGDLTVGLSSGTSGTPGLFLVSGEERARWAGLVLARLLDPPVLRRLLDPRRPPLALSFFLRASSNLYTTVASRRLRFAFHDLVDGLDRHVAALNAAPPDVLVAPATVLRRLADEVTAGALRCRPLQVVSVAEVLEEPDAQAIRAAFGAPLRQVYQCTEGFLGSTCAAGRLHLEEEHVHVAPEWLDPERRRFHPVVTDFTRTTQLVVRYRLDDVLRAGAGACPCGRASLTLEAIEGRADEVLWRPSLRDGAPTAVFPDVIRRAMALSAAGVRDYRIEQHGPRWDVRLDAGAAADAVRAELSRLCRAAGVREPEVRFSPWKDQPLHEKRRRIRCVAR